MHSVIEYLQRVTKQVELPLYSDSCQSKTIFPGGAAVAQLTVNQLVAGSNPAAGAKTIMLKIFLTKIFLFVMIMSCLRILTNTTKVPMCLLP